MGAENEEKAYVKTGKVFLKFPMTFTSKRSLRKIRVNSGIKGFEVKP